jgi:hypothetical protein
MKSGSLKLLEPSGPVKACNGIALPMIYKNNGTVTRTMNSNGVKESPKHVRQK